MAKEEEKITVDGTIIEALPGTQFRVKLDNGHEVMAYLSGRMRRYYIRILLGDSVRVEMSPYDLDRGRLVYRASRLCASASASDKAIELPASYRSWFLFPALIYNMFV